MVKVNLTVLSATSLSLNSEITMLLLSYSSSAEVFCSFNSTPQNFPLHEESSAIAPSSLPPGPQAVREVPFSITAVPTFPFHTTGVLPVPNEPQNTTSFSADGTTSAAGSGASVISTETSATPFDVSRLIL